MIDTKIDHFKMNVLQAFKELFTQFNFILREEDYLNSRKSKSKTPHQKLLDEILLP